MSAAVRVRLQNAFAKLKKIIWINEQQKETHTNRERGSERIKNRKNGTGPVVNVCMWVWDDVHHFARIPSKKCNQTFCWLMHRTILVLAAIVCAIFVSSFHCLHCVEVSLRLKCTLTISRLAGLLGFGHPFISILIANVAAFLKWRKVNNFILGCYAHEV